MAYVIAEPCIGTKDNSCTEVCPVDCIHPTSDEPGYEEADQLYIDPDECIDCDLEWVTEDVGINHEEELLGALGFLADRVNPLALGLVKRSLLQSEMMGEQLLGIRSEEVQKQDALEIVATLGKLFFHGHPINREEARKSLKLDWVVNASPEEEEVMWEFYVAYETEMKLREPFSPAAAAIAQAAARLPRCPSARASRSSIRRRRSARSTSSPSSWSGSSRRPAPTASRKT